MRVRFVRLFLGEQRMEVVVEDGGNLKKVNYVWKTHPKSDIPPEGWYEQILEEVRQQRVMPERQIRRFPRRGG